MRSHCWKRSEGRRGEGRQQGSTVWRCRSWASERACCDRSDLVAPEKNFTFASNRISRSQQTKERTSEPPLFRERRNGGQREGTHTCGGSLFVRLLSIALISLRRHSGPRSQVILYPLTEVDGPLSQLLSSSLMRDVSPE